MYSFNNYYSRVRDPADGTTNNSADATGSRSHQQQHHFRRSMSNPSGIYMFGNNSLPSENAPASVGRTCTLSGQRLLQEQQYQQYYTTGRSAARNDFYATPTSYSQHSSMPSYYLGYSAARGHQAAPGGMGGPGPSGAVRPVGMGGPGPQPGVSGTTDPLNALQNLAGSAGGIGGTQQQQTMMQAGIQQGQRPQQILVQTQSGNFITSAGNRPPGMVSNTPMVIQQGAGIQRINTPETFSQGHGPRMIVSNQTGASAMGSANQPVVNIRFDNSSGNGNIRRRVAAYTVNSGGQLVGVAPMNVTSGMNMNIQHRQRFPVRLPQGPISQQQQQQQQETVEQQLANLTDGQRRAYDKLLEISTKYYPRLQQAIRESRHEYVVKKCLRLLDVFNNPINNCCFSNDDHLIKVEQFCMKVSDMVSGNESMPTSSSSLGSTNLQGQSPVADSRPPSSNLPSQSTPRSVSLAPGSSVSSGVGVSSEPASTSSAPPRSAVSGVSVVGPSPVPVQAPPVQVQERQTLGHELLRMIQLCQKDPVYSQKFDAARKEMYEEIKPSLEKLGVPDYCDHSEDSKKDEDKEPSAKLLRLSAEAAVKKEIEVRIQSADMEDATSEDTKNGILLSDVKPLEDFSFQTLEDLPTGIKKEIGRVCDEVFQITMNPHPPPMAVMETGDSCVDPTEWNNSWHIKVSYRHPLMPCALPSLPIRLPEDYESSRLLTWYLDEKAYMADPMPNEIGLSLGDAEDYLRGASAFQQDLFTGMQKRFGRFRMYQERNWTIASLLDVWKQSINETFARAIKHSDDLS